MKVKKWLSLGEAYPKGQVIPILKEGSMTLVSGDKVIESLRTLYRAIQVPQVVNGAKGVKYQKSAKRRRDKE